MTDTQKHPDVAPSSPAPTRGWWLAWLFGATSFVGASLLFMIQPMAAKLILPSFGGSATVWSTSSLFFQILLLVGYVYAHVSTRRLGATWQPRAHLLVLLLPLVALPLTLPSDVAPASHSPVYWLLRVLALMVGLPFLVLSATGPLVQRWYAWSGGPRADDPYFLFAASNLGSFVGLLSYPFLIERTLTLTQQRIWWSVGCGIFLALMAACALVVRGVEDPTPGVATAATGAPPPRRMLLTWIFWAFVPSSLMLAATVQISTDIAAIPLLWVLPLAAYLLSFVAAFARTSRSLPSWVVWAAVVFTVATGAVSSLGMSTWTVALTAANILAVGLVGFAAHARLADSRPTPEHLTAFYLVISVGGALGGVLNGIVAPLLFVGVWEYWLTIALVPLLAWRLPARQWRPLLLVAGVGVLAVVGLVLGLAAGGRDAVATGILAAVAIGLLAWLTVRAPLLLVGLVAVGAVGADLLQQQATMHRDRTFYGSYRVAADGDLHKLTHGTTLHGTQFQSEELRRTPTTYYAPDGPLGQVVEATDPTRTAVVGLGAGAIATYGEPGDHITFFEIDPAVADLARDERYFTYLADSAADIDVVVGDGRLTLGDLPDGSVDLLVLDAFSSDAIPVHLLTREAFTEYATKLSPGGTIVVHISNRVFDLTPVTRAAADALGMQALAGRIAPTSPGASDSEWVAITSDGDVLDQLADDPGWRSLAEGPVVRWTDDYSSVLSVLR